MATIAVTPPQPAPDLAELHAKLELAMTAQPEPEPEPEPEHAAGWTKTQGQMRSGGLVQDMYLRRWTRTGFRRECAAITIQFHRRRFCRWRLAKFLAADAAWQEAERRRLQQSLEFVDAREASVEVEEAKHLERAALRREQAASFHSSFAAQEGKEVEDEEEEEDGTGAGADDATLREQPWLAVDVSGERRWPSELEWLRHERKRLLHAVHEERESRFVLEEQLAGRRRGIATRLEATLRAAQSDADELRVAFAAANSDNAALQLSVERHAEEVAKLRTQLQLLLQRARRASPSGDGARGARPDPGCCWESVRAHSAVGCARCLAVVAAAGAQQ